MRLKTARDVLDLLARQVDAVQADPDADVMDRARTVGFLASIALRAIEAGDQAARIEALERALKLRADQQKTSTAARQNRVEEDRLDAACPRGVYEVDDPAYRQRMSACATIALTVWGEVAQELAGARVAHSLGEAAPVYLDWAGAVAEAGFLAGWHAARAAHFDRPDAPAGPTPVDHDGGGPSADEVSEQDLTDLRREARRPIERLAKIAVGRVGRACATAMLSAWEGFGRFCREALELEPEAVMAALVRGAVEEVADIRAMYPDTPLNDATATAWADTLRGVWGRRFPDSVGKPG